METKYVRLTDDAAIASLCIHEKTHKLGYPGEVGGLVVLLDTAPFGATTQNIDSGAVLSDKEAKSVGCLGLKLKLLAGKTVLTTVTHAYVRNPTYVAGGSHACCRLDDSGKERTLSFSKSPLRPGFWCIRCIGTESVQ